jgi:MFS family permease
MNAYFIGKLVDIPDGNLSQKEPDVGEFIEEAEKTPLGKFTTFLMLFYIAVYLAAPFFAVYQLSILKFDYLTFTLLAAASAISSFLAMLFWGKYVDRLGSRNVLVFCGFLIPLVPFFWIFTTNPWILVYIEAFSGIVWAGFNLSVSTYLFDITDRAERTRKVAVYTLFIQLAIFIGAMAGTFLLSLFDKTNPAAYKTVFLLSAILRLFFVILFFKSLRELRIIEIPLKGRVFNRFVSVTPRHGITYEPSMENRKLAGPLAREDSKQVSEDVRKFASTARGVKQKESAMKKLERSEDDQDTASYLRKSGSTSGPSRQNTFNNKKRL